MVRQFEGLRQKDYENTITHLLTIYCIDWGWAMVASTILDKDLEITQQMVSPGMAGAPSVAGDYP